MSQSCGEGTVFRAYRESSPRRRCPVGPTEGVVSEAALVMSSTRLLFAFTDSLITIFLKTIRKSTKKDNGHKSKRLYDASEAFPCQTTSLIPIIQRRITLDAAESRASGSRPRPWTQPSVVKGKWISTTTLESVQCN